MDRQRMRNPFDSERAEVRIRAILNPERNGRSRNVSVGSVVRLGMTLICSGALIGSYSLWGGSWSTGGLLQILYSACKLPLLMGLTVLLSLPTLFVFYALAGLASEMRNVVALLIETQQVFAVVLLALSPFTLLWYASTSHYVDAVLFNTVIFTVAAAVRYAVLRRRSIELVQQHRRHRFLLRLWFVLNALVGIQLGWILRPFIGVPGSGATFIREDGWSNAYVALWEILHSAILGAG